MFLIYYTLLSGFFFFGLNDEIPQATDYTSNIGFNNTGLESTETDSGGLFSFGISLLRWTMFIALGIGLGEVPAWFQIIYTMWTVIINIMATAFVIKIIWDG